jgi:tetratricopeptide (TPR) repeat protein
MPERPMETGVGASMAKTRMRIGLIASILLAWDVNFSLADGPTPNIRKEKATGSSLKAILREASELAIEQDKEQHYWTGRVLLEIGELQGRAGDFEGAFKSIRSSNDGWQTYAALVNLAKSLARAGQRKRAFEVLFLIENSPWWPLDVLGDAVELRWIEHLIASKELSRAEKAVGQLKFNLYRPDAHMYLAAAYAEAKNTARASEHFTHAIDAASNLRDESDCSQALQKIAGAQVTVGMADGAKTTIRRIIEIVDSIKEPSAKVSVLREAAVVAAKAHDDQTAHRLFQRTIEVQKTVGLIRDALRRLPRLRRALATLTTR